MATRYVPETVELHDQLSARLCGLVEFPDVLSELILLLVELVAPNRQLLLSVCSQLRHQYFTLYKQIRVSFAAYLSDMTPPYIAKTHFIEFQCYL